MLCTLTPQTQIRNGLIPLRSPFLYAESPSMQRRVPSVLSVPVLGMFFLKAQCYFGGFAIKFAHCLCRGVCGVRISENHSERAQRTVGSIGVSALRNECVARIEFCRWIARNIFVVCSIANESCARQRLMLSKECFHKKQCATSDHPRADLQERSRRTPPTP